MSMGPTAVPKAKDALSLPWWSVLVVTSLAAVIGLRLGAVDVDRPEPRYAAEAAIPPAVMACALAEDTPGDPTWVVITIRKPEAFARQMEFTAMAFNRENQDVRWLFAGDFDQEHPCGRERP